MGTAELVQRDTNVKISILGDIRNKQVIISNVARDLGVGDGMCVWILFVRIVLFFKSPLQVRCLSHLVYLR